MVTRPIWTSVVKTWLSLVSKSGINGKNLENNSININTHANDHNRRPNSRGLT